MVTRTFAYRVFVPGSCNRDFWYDTFHFFQHYLRSGISRPFFAEIEMKQEKSIKSMKVYENLYSQFSW